MAKKVMTEIKLQIPAGQATPSPPVGPALGQRGVNIMEFCKAFNAKTQSQQGLITPVVITVYADRSFSFITKTPPAQEPAKDIIGSISRSQVEEIANIKMPDLNATDLAGARKIIEGTARSMGVSVVD